MGLTIEGTCTPMRIGDPLPTETFKPFAIPWDQKATRWMDRNIPLTIPIGNDWYNGPNPPSLNPDRIDNINNWLDSKESNIFVSVAKIVPKIIRTFILLVYHAIKFSLYTLLHPCKAVVKILNFILNALHALLTKPELWTCIGAGLIGAALGSAIVTGGLSSIPSEVGAILGFCMVGFGLFFGAVKAAYCANSGERLKEMKHKFIKQIEEMPEAFISGMTFGALLGGIEHAQKMSKATSNVVGSADDLPVLSSSFRVPEIAV